jgi:hypothetical protein
MPGRPRRASLASGHSARQGATSTLPQSLSDCHAASKACFIRTATSGPKDFDERDWLAFRVEPIRPVDDKVGRVYVNQVKFEVGPRALPEAGGVPADARGRALSLPHGKADDQVDSIIQDLSYKHSSYNPDGFNGLSRLLNGIAHQTW